MRRTARFTFVLFWLSASLFIGGLGGATAQLPSDLDRIMRWRDTQVLHQFLETSLPDKRYDAIFRRISDRLNPHISEIFPHPKEVVFYVFIGHMGFNAQTWDHITIFDSLLLDSMHDLCLGLSVYGTSDSDYVHTLAHYVVRTDHLCRGPLTLTGPPENPYSLPTIWGLTPDQQNRADTMFEEMLAGWMAHEASHALLDHTREMVEAEQLVALYRQRNAAVPDELRCKVFAPYRFTRQKEREADEHGIRLILRAGYKIDGFVASLEFAQQIEQISGEAGLNESERTHPSPLERILLAREIAAQEASR